MAHIVFMHAPYDGTGAGYTQRVYNIADQLSEEHSVTVYGRRRSSFEEFLKYNIKGGTVPFELVDTIKTRFLLKKELRDADIISVFRQFTGRFDKHLLELMKDADTPFIYDFDHVMWGEGRQDDYHPLYLRYADTVIAASTYLVDVAKEFNDNIVKIPTVCDTEKFTPQQHDGPPTIVWTENGVLMGDVTDAIVQALETLQEEYEFSLKIAGIRTAEGRRKFQNIRNTALNGLIPHEGIPEFTKDADIGLKPNHFGVDAKACSPTSLFEYMSMGIVPVATAVGQAAEAVQDGKNGFLIKENKTEYWTRKLRSALETDMTLLKEEARKTIKEEYSLESATEQYQSIISDLT